MKRFGHKQMLLGLLVVLMALLATGCALDSKYDNQQNMVSYGYYGGYGRGYYHRDVIVTPPPSSRPPHASQLPARSVPRSAPGRK